jgi:hypothetical protein
MKAKHWFITGIVVGCLAGGLIGSFFQYSFGTAPTYRKLLKQYQETRDKFQLTDKEMADFGKQMPHFWEYEERQDRMAAIHALAAFKLLEARDIEGAKTRLLAPIGMYYRLYRKKGDSPDIDVLSSIEAAAKSSPSLASEIARKN